MAVFYEFAVHHRHFLDFLGLIALISAPVIGLSVWMKRLKTSNLRAYYIFEMAVFTGMLVGNICLACVHAHQYQWGVHEAIQMIAISSSSIAYILGVYQAWQKLQHLPNTRAAVTS
jgi:Kef-type K+ transport system membrane component KefB